MGRIPERTNRNIVLIQGFFLISLGIVLNLITNSLGFILYLWQKYGNSIPSFDWMLNRIDERLKK